MLAFSSCICAIGNANEITVSQSATALNAMVVTDHALASKVGLEVLQQGGNAVDAAVAIAYALAVVEPCCGNIGGGGFMLIREKNGKNCFINFREKAPLAANSSLYEEKSTDTNNSKTGFLAVGVPGTVLGLETALKRYGTKSRAQLMQPAIQLAENGFVLTNADIDMLSPETKAFKQEANVATIFLKNGKPYKAGDRLVQLQLAHTLKLIAKEGAKVFYQGIIADKIVSASRKQGGILSKADFEKYQVEMLQPLHCRYRDFEIMTAPLPSSGGIVLCEALNILEAYPLSQLGADSILAKHYTIEAMKFAFADRSKLGDPNFVTNPTEFLISKEYAEGLQQKINPDFASSASELRNSMSNSEGDNTTHFSVIDKEGNIVALTYTLNSLFGAHVIAGDTGFFLNNEMDDFTIREHVPNQFGLVQGTANNIEAEKRPLSSMSPTIVLKNNNPLLILGAAGGPNIITANLLTLINVLDYKMALKNAVNAPRFHHQFLPDEVEAEQGAFNPVLAKELQKRGHRIVPHKRLGIEEAIYIDPRTKEINGVSDRRRPAGKAVGF